MPQLQGNALEEAWSVLMTGERQDKNKASQDRVISDKPKLVDNNNEWYAQSNAALRASDTSKVGWLLSAEQ